MDTIYELEDAFWAKWARSEEEYWAASDERFEALVLADRARQEKADRKWKKAHRL